MSTIPQQLPDGSINPLWLDSRNFIVRDKVGRILEAGYASSGHIAQRLDAGDAILTTQQRYTWQDGARVYVDLSGAAPALAQRPTFTGTFDRAQVLPRQEAVLKGLPACTVTFAGPVNGSQPHPGGDFAIGFTVPGRYVLTFEAFPCLPAALTLTVAPASA